MKKPHPVFRAISLGLGLVLFALLGTVAMIGSFAAGGPPAGTHASSAQTSEAAFLPPHSGDDSLLYQRVTRADGSAHWVLSDEPPSSVARRNDREWLAASAAGADGLRGVSYSLQAGASGLGKGLKNCRVTQTVDPYQLACSSLS